jgi:hypothetical protein
MVLQAARRTVGSGSSAPTRPSPRKEKMTVRTGTNHFPFLRHPSTLSLDDLPFTAAIPNEYPFRIQPVLVFHA